MTNEALLDEGEGFFNPNLDDAISVKTAATTHPKRVSSRDSRIDEMSSYILDEGGDSLGFLDSGVPSGISGDRPNGPGSYTTIVCVHGHTYHAQNFTRLFPVASTRGVRVVALNRRDYKGSTPYSDDELIALAGTITRIEEVNEDADGTEVVQEEFLRKRGLEIARFLVRLIKENDIPRIDEGEDHDSGGIVLLGWSLGAITTLAFLANMRSYPIEIQETLDPYLRAFLVFDLPNNSTGISPPATGGYHPLLDTSLPAHIRDMAFGTWLSSYYSHPAYSHSRSGSPVDSSPNTYINNVINSLTTKAHLRNEASTNWTISDLDVQAPARPFRKCSLDTIVPSDLLSFTDTAPGERSESAFGSLPRDLLLRQTERALVLQAGYDNSKAWGQWHEVEADNMMLSDLKVRILYGLSSPWFVQWEAWGLKDLTHEWEKEGKMLRPIEFVPIPNANHFLHWDDPERFLEVCLNAMNM